MTEIHNPRTPAPPTPEVHVHTEVQVGTERAWSILATLLATAGVVAIAYAMSLGPLRDVAATGVAVFVATLVKYLFSAGILQLPEQRPDDDLAVTKGVIRQVYGEWQHLVARSNMARLSALALAYTVVFLLFRTLVAFALGVFANVWVAIGFGALLGAVIVAPNAVLGLVRRLGTTKKGSVR